MLWPRAWWRRHPWKRRQERLLLGGCGCGLEDEPHGCGLEEPARMQGWSWGVQHRCWQRRGRPGGGTRHILFAVVLFECMKKLFVQSCMAIGLGGALHCGVGDGRGSHGALLYCNNEGGDRSCHFSKSAQSASIATNWLEDVGRGAFLHCPNHHL
jgi:hypothetical protein